MRAKTIRNVKQLLFSLAAFGFLILGRSISSSISHPPQATASISPISREYVQIVRVIDGDTIVVRAADQKDVSVRLLGVDTPEVVDPQKPIECFGKEASAFMQAILSGKYAWMMNDPAADDQDVYGRKLRNLVLENGMDVNAELVKRGYARALVEYPMNETRKTDLKKWETDAKDNHLGLWNPSTCDGKK